MMTRICNVCQKEFLVTKKTKKYCSAECRMKSNKTLKDYRNFTCAYCQKDYMSKRKTKYCSKDCYLKANGRGAEEMTNEPEKKIIPIHEIEAMARELGLTYGQYMARHGSY